MGQLYHNIPRAQGVPGGVYVCVQVLLGGLASADAVAWVVVGEDVAVDASPEADVEAAHLAEVDRVPVGEEHGESERRDERRLVEGYLNKEPGSELVYMKHVVI